MTDKKSNATGTLISIAAFVIIIAGIKASGAILVPFFLSAFIAVLCAPAMHWLNRKGISAGIAIFIIMFSVFLAGFGLAVLVGSSIDSFSQNLPYYQTRIQNELGTLIKRLASMNIRLPLNVLIKSFDPTSAMKLMTTFLAAISNALTNAFFILLTVIFILSEASSFTIKLRQISDDSETSLKHLNQFFENLKRYMSIKTIISIVTGILISFWLFVLGVDYALLWGLLAFLFNYVPNLGSIIAAVPAVLLAYIQVGGGTSLLTAFGYIVVNIIMGNVIEPRYMGKGVGLSTLVVFLSLVFWGWVLGPIGMLLSVPLTMMIKIALETNYDTRWLAIILGPAETPVKGERYGN